jgi:hypothetical protein
MIDILTIIIYLLIRQLIRYIYFSSEHICNKNIINYK